MPAPCPSPSSSPALAKGALLSREIRAATIGLALMLLYAMGGFTPVFRLVFAIPGIDLFRRPADALFLAGALAALATGYLVHRIFSGSFLAAGRPWGLAEWSVAVAAFAAAFWLAVSRGTLASAGLAFATSAAFLAAALLLLSRLPALARTRPLAAMLVLAAFLVADLRFNSGPNESTALPPADFEMLRQDSRSPLVAALKARLPAGSLDRIELAGLGFAWPNASLVHRFDNVLGYNPVRLALYSEATGAEDHVALPDQRRFSPLFPSYRSTLADLLGLRFIATGVPVEAIDPALKPGDLTPLARTPQGYLYENPRAGPRLRVVPNALAIDQDALLRDGRWPAVDLATTVLLSALPPGAPAPSHRPVNASVRLVAAHNTRMVVDVTSEAAAYLVVADPYQPWWEARIDGAPAPLLRADGIFRAVPVPAGAHRVSFVFRPFKGAWRDAQKRWPVLQTVATIVGLAP